MSPAESTNGVEQFARIGAQPTDHATWDAIEDSAQSLDPYVLWDYVNRGADDHTPVPVAIEFITGSNWQIQPELAEWVSPVFHGSNFGTARITRPKLLRLIGKEFDHWVKRVRLGRAGTARAPEPPSPWEASDAMRPAPLTGTVVAVVDDGCAFAHERFRYRDSNGRWRSRIQYLWDQGGKTASATAPWCKAGDLGYGRELRGNSIDALLNDSRFRRNGVIDEEAIYRHVGCPRADNLELHGTHVLDLAAGCGPDERDARLAPNVVFVQVPADAVSDTSGGWLNANLLDALWYVHSRVAIDAKLVINVSLGALAGPHDGSSLLEQAMESLASLRSHDFAIVLAAGNGFMSMCRARLTVPPHATGELVWRVRSDDPTESLLELWYPKRANIALLLRIPTLRDSPPVEKNSAISIRYRRGDSATNPVAAVIHRADGGNGTDSMAVIAAAPCDLRGQERSRGSLAAAPSGTWRLEINNRGDESAVLDAFIERDEPVPGSLNPSERQPVFVSLEPTPADTSFGPPLRGEDTSSSIAHGSSTVVVGGCVGGACPTVAEYSASGPSRGGPRYQSGPDVVAVSDESPTLDGVLAAGARSGYRFRMNGTSVAAPQVTRWIARHLSESRVPQSIADIKGALRAAASVQGVLDPHQAGNAPSHRTGAGLVSVLP